MTVKKIVDIFELGIAFQKAIMQSKDSRDFGRCLHIMDYLKEYPDIAKQVTWTKDLDSQIFKVKQYILNTHLQSTQG